MEMIKTILAIHLGFGILSMILISFRSDVNSIRKDVKLLFRRRLFLWSIIFVLLIFIALPLTVPSSIKNIVKRLF